MKMRTLLIALAAVSTSAYADRFAPVVRVDPVVQTYIVPRVQQECAPVQVPLYANVPIRTYHQASENSSAVGTFLGAIVGIALVGDASIGAQVGGALVGGAIGNAIGSSPSSAVIGYQTQITGYQWQQKCEDTTTYHERQQVIGYSVTYLDNGITRTVNMLKPPGSHVRLITTQ